VNSAKTSITVSIRFPSTCPRCGSAWRICRYRESLFRKAAGALPDTGAAVSVLAEDRVLRLEEVERRYLQRVLARHRGDKRTLAGALGISERTLYRKLKRHRLAVPGRRAAADE